jgi:phosphoribosylformylglycinamidine synthase subunit PurQ / glutaminase
MARSLRAQRSSGGAVMKPVALVVSAPGTNRNHDAACALELAGATSEQRSLREIVSSPRLLDGVQLLVLAGGFSYADALGAGTLAGVQWRGLADHVRSFVATGRPVLGICNGFQMLVRSGLLPGSLTHNASGRFICKWVTLQPNSEVSSVWTDGLDQPIQCPVAHGEGRYLPNAEHESLRPALRYVNSTNPNGSVGDIAGVVDETGLILGMMPHPENHVLRRQHPRFARGLSAGLALPLFVNGVAHVQGRG